MRVSDPGTGLLGADPPVEIPPLTRNGYTRTPRTERDIQKLWHAGHRRLADAFSSPDDDLPDRYSTEALIFFIRRAVFSGERVVAEDLFECLMKRCRPAFAKAFRANDEAEREDLQSEVLADIIRLLLAEDDSGDFLQSRFWLYLRRRIVTARRDWLRARARMLLSADLAVEDEEGTAIDQELASSELTPEDRAILSDALARLPQPLRELVILRFYEGWRVGDESSDTKSGAEPTLSEFYKITPRAVRKRLAKAQELLKSKEG